MPDPYSQITSVDPEVLPVLINAMEVRAADPRQKAIRDTFLSSIGFPEGASVLEIGCGSGAVCRDLAGWSKVGQVVGLDPSPVFLAKARDLASGISNLRFDEGDARSLPYDAGAFDVIVLHTCLTHVPGPDKALAEAFRVLRSGGCLAVLEGDYVTTTVAVGQNDPLQDCVESAMNALVHDRWLARKLLPLTRIAGFRVEHLGSHGFMQTDEPEYMLTLIDRGADILVKERRIGRDLAQFLKGEARQRIDRQEFFGFIAFISLIARKPN